MSRFLAKLAGGGLPAPSATLERTHMADSAWLSQSTQSGITRTGALAPPIPPWFLGHGQLQAFQRQLGETRQLLRRTAATLRWKRWQG